MYWLSNSPSSSWSYGSCSCWRSSRTCANLVSRTVHLDHHCRHWYCSITSFIFHRTKNTIMASIGLFASLKPLMIIFFEHTHRKKTFFDRNSALLFISFLSLFCSLYSSMLFFYLLKIFFSLLSLNIASSYFFLLV